MVGEPRYERGEWVAGFAARVASVVDLDRLTGYAELSTADRLARARAEDTAYLARLCAVLPDAVVEFRRGHGRLVVGGTLRRADRDGAAHAAAEALRAVLRGPEHVVLEECEPPGPAGAPAVELSRRCAFGQPARPDAGVRYYLAVPPMRSSPQAWSALLDGLGGAELSVTLSPLWLGQGFAAVLSSVADQYERLAKPTVLRTDGVYHSAIDLPPEPFAVSAAPVFRDAAARYRGLVHRMRVTLSGFADPHLPVRLATALGAEHPGAPRAEVPQSFRLLRELADAHDAAQVVCLPAGAAGGFAVSEPPAARTTGGGIVFDRSTVTVEGDLFGGGKYGVT